MNFSDGITFSSGFGQLPSFADSAFNSNLPRFSILTQKTGEQKRLSNVPDTISKSASALNIRVADLTQQHAAAKTTTTASKSKPAQHKTGKRQSILNMVVKPGTGSTRRPSCPTLPMNKSQTFSHASMATPAARPGIPSFNVHSSDNGDLQHNQTLTVGRPVPKFQIEPPTPAVVGEYDGNSVGNGLGERWRFGSGRDSEGDDGPPALPSRVTRNASSVERRENYKVTNRYRNSMEEPLTKSIWRDSDLFQDDDEDSRDPDYDLPRLNYDCEDLNQAAAVGDALQTEADEDDEDRDDDYSYPQFLYTVESSSTEAQFRNAPLSIVEETDGTNDSYDYLPAYRRGGSDRTSACRSSAQMSGSDNASFDDRGIYDVLPKRDSCSMAEGTTGSRMSGIEPGLDDSGTCIYQNDSVFCRSPTDIYDYPPLQNQSSPFPGAEYSNGILPPLPEKKTHGRKEEVEKVVVEKVEKRRVVPPPPSFVPSQSDEVHNYMNAGDVRMSSYSNSSSQDEGVYLPMTCGKPSETIYTPMHSPQGNIFKPVPPSDSNCNRSEEEAKSSLDVVEPALPKQNLSPGKLSITRSHF